MTLIPLPGGPLKTAARQAYDVAFALIAMPIMWVERVPDIGLRMRAFIRYSRFEDYPLRHPPEKGAHSETEALV